MVRTVIGVVLAVAAVASALAVVQVQHERRNLFVELQRLERERDRMDVEWGRLRLERSAWTANDRVRQIARDKLQMHVPPAQSIVLVTP